MAGSLARLRAAGFVLTASGDRLLAAPSSRLTPEWRAIIRAQKPEILAELVAEADGLAPFARALRLGTLVVCGRCRHYAEPQPGAELGRCAVLHDDVAGAVPFHCHDYAGIRGVTRHEAPHSNGCDAITSREASLPR